MVGTRHSICRSYRAFLRVAAGKSGSSAFTLIELLAVMAIVVILAGAVTGAAFAIIKSVQRKSTNNLLTHLADGLEDYKLEHGMYVPHPVADVPADHKMTTIRLWYALEHDNSYVATIGENRRFLSAGPEGNTDPATGEDLAYFIYIDAWKTELLYTCEAPYKTFTIRSFGPDTTYDTEDDLVKE